MSAAILFIPLLFGEINGEPWVETIGQGYTSKREACVALGVYLVESRYLLGYDYSRELPCCDSEGALGMLTDAFYEDFWRIDEVFIV